MDLPTQLDHRASGPTKARWIPSFPVCCMALLCWRDQYERQLLPLLCDLACRRSSGTKIWESWQGGVMYQNCRTCFRKIHIFFSGCSLFSISYWYCLSHYKVFLWDGNSLANSYPSPHFFRSYFPITFTVPSIVFVLSLAKETT